jgi:hypothetical protein
MGLIMKNLNPDALADLYEACKMANIFIRNGIEMGYIQMPDIAIDPALKAPGILQAALDKADGKEVVK